MFDLHAHTVASDGEHTPSELLELALQAGLKALAITDHDTVSALAAAKPFARERGLELVCGIEVTASVDSHEIHLLGHFIDPDDAALRAHARRLASERTDRMQAMLDKLAKQGFSMQLGEVEAIARGAPLGRPHLARALVERRICTSTQEAFARFLADGRPIAVEHFRFPADEAIALIHTAGGTATLAHPGPCG